MKSSIAESVATCLQLAERVEVAETVGSRLLRSCS